MQILKTGSRGPDVQLLQLALNRAGFDSGSRDGFFGRQTAAAARPRPCLRFLPHALSLPAVPPGRRLRSVCSG